jgi:hypothetical protein
MEIQGFYNIGFRLNGGQVWSDSFVLFHEKHQIGISFTGRGGYVLIGLDGIPANERTKDPDIAVWAMNKIIEQVLDSGAENEPVTKSFQLWDHLLNASKAMSNLQE